MIIAVDFDGVLCKNKFPEIGEPNYDIISKVRQLIDSGHEVILWTTRNGKELEDAVSWCNNRGLFFCNVNGPAPSNEEIDKRYPTSSRKIYADVYVDDHSLEYVMLMKNRMYTEYTISERIKDFLGGLTDVNEQR